MCGKLVTRRRPASSSAAVPNDGGLWTILHRGEASVLAKPAAQEHVQSRASARSKRIVQPVKWFQFAADSARYSLQTSTKGTGPRIFGRRRPIVSSSTHENDSRKCYLFVAVTSIRINTYSFPAGVVVLFGGPDMSSEAAVVAQGRWKVTPEVLVLALHRLPARASYRYRYRESQFSPRVAGAWCRQVLRV